MSYCLRLPDWRMAAVPNRWFPWGPRRMSSYFRGCLQFAPVALGEVGVLMSTLLFCLENTFVCILLDKLVSPWGRGCDRGRGVGLYCRVAGIRVILWKTKRRQGPWEERMGLGRSLSWRAKGIQQSYAHHYILRCSLLPTVLWSSLVTPELQKEWVCFSDALGKAGGRTLSGVGVAIQKVCGVKADQEIKFFPAQGSFQMSGRMPKKI